MKTHFVAKEISSLCLWVFMDMVDNDSYIGSIAKNPFNLKHFSES